MSEKPRLVKVGVHTDGRGEFQKYLDPLFFRREGIPQFLAIEMFSSSTKLHGLRGMHFQMAPHKIRKLVWVTRGSILDVVVSLQKNKDLGQVESFHLNDREKNLLYVPADFAHGFQSLEEDTVVNYLTDGEFNSKSDSGFCFNSFNFDWPYSPRVISKKDISLPTFKEFCEYL